MGFSVDRRCYDGNRARGGEVGAEFFRKVFPIVDFRTSSLSLSLPLPSLSLSSITVCLCVVRPALRYERGGRVHGRRSMERRGTLIGTCDGTVMPIN